MGGNIEGDKLENKDNHVCKVGSNDKQTILILNIYLIIHCNPRNIEKKERELP